MIGVKYNKLVAIKEMGVDKSRRKLYLFECDCGNKKIASAIDVRGNRVKSCGCLLRKHGKSGTLIYGVWSHMIKRCYKKSADSYSNYGGRGIKVCERWREDFRNFYEDMGDKPSSNSQIDRINNDGDYEPSNCRWVTPSQNCLNRRNKENKTGFKNIKVTPYGAYRARVVRERYERISLTRLDINDALKIRDLYIEEYNENPQKWIENTINKDYLR